MIVIIIIIIIIIINIIIIIITINSRAMGQFQSGCRAVTGDAKAVGGRSLAVGNAFGAGVGVWESF